MAQNYRNSSGRQEQGRGGRYQTGGDQDRYRTGGEQRFNPASDDRVHWHGGGYEGDREYSRGGYSEEFGYRRGRNRDEQSRDARSDQYQSRGSSGANYQSGRSGSGYDYEGQSRYDEGRFDEANRWSEGADDVGPEETFSRAQRTATSSWREDPNDQGGFFNTGSYVDDGGASRGFGDDFNRARQQVQQRYGTGGGSRGQSGYSGEYSNRGQQGQGSGYYGSQSGYGRGSSDQQRSGAQQSWRGQQGGGNSYQDRSSWNYGEDRGQRAGSGSSGGAYGYDAGAYRSEQSTQSHRGRGPQGYQRSDDRLKELICERLTEDPQIDASNVSIDVSGQVVKLTGTVDDRSTKYEIEELIESMGGVKDIDNQLRVQRSQSNWNQSGSSQGSTQGSASGSGSGTSTGSNQQSRGGSDWDAGSNSLSSSGTTTGRSGSASGTSTSSGSSTSGSTTSPSKRN
jgi:osmotically-inducible protein OsmY